METLAKTIFERELAGELISLDDPDYPQIYAIIRQAQRRSTYFRPIIIRRNAWLGANATVMSGVTIGENAVFGAGAVVTKDVAPNCIVAGVPARVVKAL